jgi:hypothetical protein
VNQLPEFLEKSAVRRLDLFCQSAQQHPQRPRLIRYRVAGLKIYLFEVRRYLNRPHEFKELPMALFRFSPELNQWSLHHQHGDHWQLYLNIHPTLKFDNLLTAINQDPLGFFWRD